MELCTEQRKAISDNCLPMSWQMLSAWRLQHMGSLHDDPDVVAEWLAEANPRSQALAEEMVRFMADRLWRIELRAVHATAGVNQHGLRLVDVTCGGARWTLGLLPQPRLHLHSISR